MEVVVVGGGGDEGIEETGRESNPLGGKVLASTSKSLPELSSGWNYRRGVQSCLELLRPYL